LIDFGLGLTLDECRPLTSGSVSSEMSALGTDLITGSVSTPSFDRVSGLYVSGAKFVLPALDLLSVRWLPVLRVSGLLVSSLRISGFLVSDLLMSDLRTSDLWV